MPFDIKEIRRFGGLTDQDATLLGEMKPMLEKHSPTLVKSFMKTLTSTITSKIYWIQRKDDVKS